ncbi:hypothetical protein LOD99_14955 [Oopsacas minuta]|uniref:EF-hand domain-containing protein n=1 Tax=Oopsacas minuta TaxID=111878 RepID=A0AAV7KGR1_9METZ|nr:hypothetical protein LOD99_14955 [Oopsacas minuta]
MSTLALRYHNSIYGKPDDIHTDVQIEDKQIDTQQNNIETLSAVDENNVVAKESSDITSEDKEFPQKGITGGQDHSKNESSADIKDNIVENSENIPSIIEESYNENTAKESPVISATNLIVIQGESDTEAQVDNGLLSLDVTIAIEDGAIDSCNNTQDIQANKHKAIAVSESHVLSIKGTQVLRAKALSRLANIDPSPVRTRVNTPLDYNSPGLAWNVDFISIEQFSQLTEFFWGTCPESELVENLLAFIREGYIETEYEREERLREDWLQKLRINQYRHLVRLYTIWDNDRAGYISREEFISKLLARTLVDAITSIIFSLKLYFFVSAALASMFR